MSRHRGPQYIASLAKWADILELDDPRKSFKVKAHTLEIRKKVNRRSRQAEGLRVQYLQRALELFNPQVPRFPLDFHFNIGFIESSSITNSVNENPEL